MGARRGMQGRGDAEAAVREGDRRGEGRKREGAIAAGEEGRGGGGARARYGADAAAGGEVEGAAGEEEGRTDDVGGGGRGR